MNLDLIDNNYLIIRKFIEEERAIKIAEQFKKDAELEDFEGDTQAPNSASVYNYRPALELLCEKVKEVSEEVGEIVLPTYCYSRIYRNKSTLDSHTDRPECEISLTLHLNGDMPWAIWIKTPEGNTRCVTLNPGDAMVYLGCIAEHWRDIYRGEWYAQMFLHYVRSRGPCGYGYFDKNQKNKMEAKMIIQNLDYKNDEKEKTIKNDDKDIEKNLELLFKKLYDKVNASSLNNSLEVLKSEKKVSKESPIILGDSVKSQVEEVKPSVTSSSSINSSKTYQSRYTLDDYVVFLEKFIPDELCDRILNEYKNDEDWSSAQTGGGLSENIRNCSVINMSERSVISANLEVRSKIDEEMYEWVAKILQEYEIRFPHLLLEIKEDSGYELLRYSEGQFYTEHTDHFKEQPRTLSVSINLNDDYDGGEFAFFDREIIAKNPKGSVIVFPSNFMYPHEVMPVTKGTRYSIITWLI
jgi:predicted 2-oxoglutarate/Fe(II)-dependent dioxygenase YbiX